MRHIKSNIAMDTILATFVKMAKDARLTESPPQRLVVPYFFGEFNRCVEHMTLNQMIQSPACSGDTGWYQVGMACRINDTKKVEFGSHATVFEMLTAVWQHDSNDINDVHPRLAKQVVGLLVDGIGFDVGRLRVTYCSGGEVLPGIIAEPDEMGRSAFARAGISEANLVPIRGPKNFILFVGDGERVGIKYEVQYLTTSQGREQWLEVATAIVDCYLLRPGQKSGAWELQKAKSVVAGCAFGLERLVATHLGGRGISVSPVLSDLLSAIGKASMQDSRAIDLLEGDRLILADLVRSSMFLMADGNQADGATAECRLIVGLIRRIRRKIATLCFENWERVLTDLEEIVTHHYQERYPGIVKIKGELVRMIASIPWPEAWNPDSYNPIDTDARHA